MANVIRLDIINGNPRTFVHSADLEQGLFLEIVGKANAVMSDGADYEAYSVKLASATTVRGQLLLHASVCNQYENEKTEEDFVLKAGRAGRGYQPVMGDIVTLPVALCGGTVEVGEELVLGANGKLAVGTTGAIAVVEALEDLTIPNAEAQASAVIRFY